MIKFLDSVTDYFDPAYTATAEGIRELQSLYDDCPVGLYPDMKNPGCEVLKLNPLLDEPPTYQKLESYIRCFYSMQLRSSLEQALWSGRIKVPFDSYGRVSTISDVFIGHICCSRGLDSDIEVRRLKVNEDDPIIRTDVQMSACVSTEDMSTECHGRKVSFWIQVYMNLLNRSLISSGRITSGCLYGQKKGMPLDEYLVPYVGTRNMESVAERMLRQICPEALTKPMRLDIKKILDRLGLELLFVRISPEFRFMGRVFFEEGDIRVYDVNGRGQPLHVRKGTILVDERVLRRTEAVNWTIMHEICHFLQHREFFYLQRIYDDTLKCLSYSVEEYREQDKDSPLYWIEWQTGKLTARVMIPIRTAKIMAENLLKKNAYLGRTAAMERTIIELALFYGVSRQMAKIRMEEMGYTDAKGVLNFVDRGYVPAYYGLEKRKKNMTPDIPENAALDLYISNSDFRVIVDKGCFCFVENHFCLRDEKYLMQGKNGEPALTSYARNHIDECCILFEKIPGEKRYTYSVGTFNNEVIYTGPELYRPIDIPSRNPMEREEVMNRRLEIYLEALEGTPMRFGPALQYHRMKRDFTQDQLAEQVCISVRQLSKYENSEVKQPVQRTVIAMCIAMKLETDLSDSLLTKGKCTPGTEPEDLILLYVLHTMYEYSISYCNRFLKNRNLQPLTREECEENKAVS